MADLQNRGTLADIQATLTRLRGVVSARVVRNDQGEIEEIHVLADEARHPKQLGRDVESALFSEFGIRIDHRKISIAQMRDGHEPGAGDVRLKFLSIDYSLDRTAARARVSVSRGDDTFVGAATMPAGGEVSQEELVSRATLEAMHEFLRAAATQNGDIAMELRDFSRAESQGKPFFTATVRLHGAKGEQDLIGSAIVRDDPWRAAVCATLDAVNRRLGSLVS